MKKYLYLLVFSICAGFAACSSSDDDDDQGGVPGPYNEPATQAPDEAKPFVGGWHLSTLDEDWFFYQDGVVEHTKSYELWPDNIQNWSSYIYWRENFYKQYSWNYNAANQLLTTNISTPSSWSSVYQWNITLVSDDSWVGTESWVTKAVRSDVASPLDTATVIAITSRGVWYADNGDSIYVNVSNAYYNSGRALSFYYNDEDDSNGVRSETLYFQRRYDNATITYDESKDIMTLYSGKKGENDAGEDQTYHQKLEIVHPYSYKDAYINIDVYGKYTVDEYDANGNKSKHIKTYTKKGSYRRIKK